jgi:hypothetical protein
VPGVSGEFARWKAREDRRHDRELRESLQQRQRRMRVLLAAACISVVLGALGVLGYVVERGLRMRAEASERNAQLAYATGALDQGTALHLAGRGYESRRAFERSRDQLRQLGESTLAPQVGLYRSFREFESPLNTLPHADGVMAAAWLPDSTHAVSAGDEGIIRLWDVPAAGPYRTFRRQNANISAAGHLRRRALAALGGADQSVPTVGHRQRQEICKLGEHLGEIRGVAFPRTGRGLAAQPIFLARSTLGCAEWQSAGEGHAPTRSAFYGVAFAPDDGRALGGTPTNARSGSAHANLPTRAPPITGHSGYDSKRLLARRPADSLGKF